MCCFVGLGYVFVVFGLEFGKLGFELWFRYGAVTCGFKFVLVIWVNGLFGIVSVLIACGFCLEFGLLFVFVCEPIILLVIGWFVWFSWLE